MADYQVKILPLGRYEDLYGFLISMVVGKTGEQDGSRGRGAGGGGESADHPPYRPPYHPHHSPHSGHVYLEHPHHPYHPLRHRHHYPPLYLLFTFFIHDDKSSLYLPSSLFLSS